MDDLPFEGPLKRLWTARRVPAATVAAIYLADAAGDSPVSVTAVDAIAQRGLAGDRYCAGRGFWKVSDACQVTLIAAEDLERAARRAGIRLDDGRHRRNLVVRGLRLDRLEGSRLRIGEALFGWHRNRPPCGYLDRVAGAGTAKALGRRSGVCLRVLRGGRVRVGDPVELVELVDGSART